MVNVLKKRLGQGERSGMSRIFFASFPRSGSVWYLTMLGESIGADKREMVYEHTMKVHGIIHNQIKWFGPKDKIFYMYRHPKDALWSYAWYEHRGREMRIWKEGGKRGAVTGETIKKKFDKKILEEILFTPATREPFLCASWWIAMMEYYMGEELRTKVDVCYIRYEDVLINPIREVKKGLDFIGYDVKPQIEKHLTSPCSNDRLMIHTGKYKHYPQWTKEIDDRINEELGENLEKYGYEK